MFAGDNPSFEAGQFLLAALDQASDAVVIVDDQALVVHFNTAAERMWGTPAAEILGRDAASLGIKLSEHHDREIAIRRKDGSLAKGALSLSRVEVCGAINTMVFVRD